MQDSVLDRLTEVVTAGGAVCLLGAGYSLAGTDQSKRGVPSTSDLISEIKEAVGIAPAEYASLSDVAGYCEDSAAREQMLRRLLISRLTLCNPDEDQISVASHPWRSIFTTNFDDLVERSRPDGSLQVITPDADPGVHTPGKTPLYYMHGRALDLIESDVNPHFVLSERNYLQLHEDNRALYARLKNELFCANLIVVVGYSMRDLEVARILMEGGHAFKRKTVIVCDPAETQMALARLNKFGEVLPIGIAGLAERLRDAPQQKKSGEVPPFQFINALRSAPPAPTIEGDDFINLILTGSFSREKYQAQLQQSTSSSELYCVRRRDALDVVTKRAAGGLNRFIVSSDLGNGKSLFLDQLAEELLTSGHTVIRIASNLEEVFSEVEAALASRQPLAFLIDDTIRYRRVAQFVGTRLTSLSIMVCSVRGDPGEVALQELINSLGGAARHIDLNRLSMAELQDWDLALERWGLWEQRISLSRDQRIAFLSQQCAAENRSIVLSLFRSSQIAGRIDQIVSFFLRSGRYERAFAALLTSSLCQQHVAWESLVSWLDIDEAKLRRDISRSEISSLFVNGREWNAFTSAQLAEYILRTKYVEFDSDTLVDVFSTIVLCTAESASDSYLGSMFRENLKELMKFRFLTRLFGEGEAAVKLIGTVYSRLSKAKLIRSNPQFWLQYAMSRMEAGDLLNAETYLNTALGLAIERGANYSPFQILDQRARLYFKKNGSAAVTISRTEINTAIKDLHGLLDHPDGEIIYLYRSVPIIGEFVEAHVDRIPQDLKAEIRRLLESIQAKGQGYNKLPRAQKGETKVLQKAMSDALITLKYG